MGQECVGGGVCVLGSVFASLLTLTSLPHWRKQSQTLLEGHTGQRRGNSKLQILSQDKVAHHEGAQALEQVAQR